MNYESMLAVLQSESEERKRLTRTITKIILGILGIQAGALGYLIGSGKETFGGAMLSILPVLAIMGASAGFTPKAKSALVAAVKTGDTRLVGHLCEALMSGDSELVTLAKKALVDLSPMLTDESEPLDKVQHAGLLHGVAIAEGSKDEEFIAAALKCLAKVGRYESIPVLEQFSKVDESKRPRVHAAALSALPDLRMRLAREIIQRAIAEVDARRSLQEPTEDHLTH